MKYIILCYIIILVLQYFYVKYYIKNWMSNIKNIGKQDFIFNNNNKTTLISKFNKVIEDRIKMLDDMTYVDWIDYNNKNPIIDYNGHKYDLVIYEYIKNGEIDFLSNSDYIMRANNNPTLIGLSYSDIIKEQNYNFVFTIFNLNPNMLNNMYHTNNIKGGINNATYYGVDAETHRSVKQEIISTNFTKKENNGIVDGILFISYNILDIELTYSNKYYDYINPLFMVSMSIFIFITSILLYYSTNSIDLFKPLLFLFGSNAYMTYFMSTIEGITTVESEQNKVKDINDGILSISFLVAVNLFIIETLKKSQKKYSLHNESAFLFCISLILLMLALYKKTNYNKIDDIREHRIEKQFMYNFSIFVNIFILFNYLIYIGKETNIIKMIVKNSMSIFN